MGEKDEAKNTARCKNHHQRSIVKQRSNMSIKIYLRDKNEKIVSAWSREFSSCTDVDVSCGDIFDITADAIISPANSFGFMDGGIDLAYSEYFGWELQERLQEKIRNKFYGELPVGCAAIVETGNDDIKYLLSCPTMRVPEDVSNTVNASLAFRAGLIAILNFNNKHTTNISSVICPGLGTLTGRITANNCAKQMKSAYDSIVCNKIEFPSELPIAYMRHAALKQIFL
jgi:O-acetyl-ADP-ribose deacetylase (regulator of RNase III)